jgi:hypothetical protein
MLFEDLSLLEEATLGLEIHELSDLFLFLKQLSNVILLIPLHVDLLEDLAIDTEITLGVQGFQVPVFVAVNVFGESFEYHGFKCFIMSQVC